MPGWVSTAMLQANLHMSVTARGSFRHGRESQLADDCKWQHQQTQLGKLSAAAHRVGCDRAEGQCCKCLARGKGEIMLCGCDRALLCTAIPAHGHPSIVFCLIMCFDHVQRAQKLHILAARLTCWCALQLCQYTAIAILSHHATPQLIYFTVGMSIMHMLLAFVHMLLAWYICAANGTPGPSSYSPTTAATASRKAAFSLRARPHIPSRSSSGPGPGHYPCASDRPHVGKAPNSPRYTFGVKSGISTEGDRKPGPSGELCCRQCLVSVVWA